MTRTPKPPPVSYAMFRALHAVATRGPMLMAMIPHKTLQSLERRGFVIVAQERAAGPFMVTITEAGRRELGITITRGGSPREEGTNTNG